MERAKLYKELAERIGLGGSERIAKLFSMIASPEEAGLMLSMPGTVEELASRTGQAPSDIQEMIEVLFRKGLVFESRKSQGTVFRMCRHVIQFHDATILWKEAPREFLDAWQEYMETEWPALTKKMHDSGVRPLFRVIPVDETVKPGAQVLPYDTAKRLVEGARRLAVTNCTCRLTARKCDAPLEVCIQMDRAADYAIKRDTGRPLSTQEAIEILRISEDAGLVHCSDNRAGIGHVICNCCHDCCQLLPLVIKHGRRLLDPSRFVAQVEGERCQGCGTCVERCLFKAIVVTEGEDKERAYVLEEKCMGCGLCATSCPQEAIELSEVRPQDFIPS